MPNPSPTPEDQPEIHPVQNDPHGGIGGRISSLVTLRAYEVYCELYGPQPALLDLAGKNCRGGFSSGELIAFLYAHSYPKSEWRARVAEAFKGMIGL